MYLQIEMNKPGSERPNCLFSGSAEPEPESELFDRTRTPNQNRTIYFYKSVQK